MMHPQFHVQANRQTRAGNSGYPQTEPQERFTPVYPTTYGLTQHVIRKAIDNALLLLKRNPPVEILPESLHTAFLDVATALTIIHHPPLDIDINELTTGRHPAIKRFIFEELLAYHLSMLTIKLHNQKQHAYNLKPNQHFIQPFWRRSLLRQPVHRHV